MRRISRYRAVLLWQLVFILVGVSWLYAPWLNPLLSTKFSMISYYEDANQAFSWLFRGLDAVSGLLLLFATWRLYAVKSHIQRAALLFLAVAALGLLLDPIFPTSCEVLEGICHETAQGFTIVHVIETALTSFAVFGLTVYDVLKRRRALPSVLFLLVQITYLGYFFLTPSNQATLNTVMQFAYQFTTVVWLSYFVRAQWAKAPSTLSRKRIRLARIGFAALVFSVGIFSILISLVHLRFFGPIDHLYQIQGTWFSQHGVLVGLVLLYLSRHLYRGEHRARQLVLGLLMIEVIRFAIITPEATLLGVYLVLFSGLFVLADAFTRGMTALTWEVRLKDLVLFIGGIFISLLLVFEVAIHHTQRLIMGEVSEQFTNVLKHTPGAAHVSHAGTLFIHNVSFLLFGVVVVVLWVLFRPNVRTKTTSRLERDQALRFLKTHSTSSEDYFKYWPNDKNYFFGEKDKGFVAYRRSGSVVFALADPIGDRPPELLREFVEYCHRTRLKVCFLPVREETVGIYEAAGLKVLQIGASAVVDIPTFCTETSRDKWWRWQRNRATKAGYVHRLSMPPHSSELITELRTISNAWLHTGGHKERGFVLGYFDETYIHRCAIHYLVDESATPVAFVNILPQWADTATVTIDLLRYLPDHNGSMPFLLSSLITNLAETESQKLFDLGFVPFAASEGTIVRLAKLVGGKRFSSKGLEQFKNKFDPVWLPNYIAYDGDIADLGQITMQLEKVMSVDLNKMM